MSWTDFIYPGMGKAADSFLHPEKGYQKAGEQLQQYYRDAQGRLQPYNANGQNQFARLTQQADALDNPAKLQADWAKTYEMSPQAMQDQKNATASGMDAASSMGLQGSSAALQNVQNSSGQIMQRDRQSYMDDLMKKYMASIGIGQNIYGIGASAAGQQSNNAMTMGQNMGQLAYGQQNAPGAMFGDLIGKATNAGINYATGGIGKAA